MQKKMTSKTKNNKRKLASTNNFLEALRDLGNGIVDSAVDDVAKGVPREAYSQVMGKKKSGELKPNQTLDLKEIAQAVPQEKPTFDFQREFLSIRRQEKLVWTRAEQETKLQIAAVLEELKKLASSTKLLAKEVEVAAKQVPVEPGVYHLNFFEKLRKTIILLRKKIDESATWLSAVNHRAKRRNYYWAQVKKSGTKFLLSQERYMATQAG